MTDEQIIKAFEEILKNQNNKLSLIERAVCDDVLSLANRQKVEIEELRSDKIIAERHEKDARDLFVDCTRQLEEAKAEIERLTAKILAKNNINDYNTAQLRIAREELRTAKSEAIKEFAEQLKGYAIGENGSKEKAYFFVEVQDIDNLVREMTEADK